MVESICLYDTVALPLATREAGGVKALSEGLTGVVHEDQKIGKAFRSGSVKSPAIVFFSFPGIQYISISHAPTSLHGKRGGKQKYQMSAGWVTVDRDKSCGRHIHTRLDVPLPEDACPLGQLGGRPTVTSTGRRIGRVGISRYLVVGCHSNVEENSSLRMLRIPARIYGHQKEK